MAVQTSFRPSAMDARHRDESRPEENFAQLIARVRRPTFSVEFFPPRDDAAAEVLHRSIGELEPLRPDFVSVTYGANGSSRGRTLSAVRDIVDSTSLRVVGHLTCTGQSVAQLEEVVDSYGELGVHHILALRGDMPGGPLTPWEPHPQGLRDATELVELVRARGDFCVGVAAFPDIHPGSTAEDDLAALLAKQAAGAQFAITQLFFRPVRYRELLTRMRAAGCTLPVLAGMMPVTTIRQLDKFAELSGAPLPEQLRARLNAVAEDPQQVRRVGAQVCAELATELLDGGAPGLHFFTQNRSVATREILARLLGPHR